MENLNNNINTVNNASNEEANALSLRDIWSIIINNWKWFVLSLAVFLVGGTYYILRITPSYSRGASVLIKEDPKGSSYGMDISTAFSNMGIGNGTVNVNNEIINFKSPDLMLQVVRNLNMDVNYFRKGRFHDYPLYGSTQPVAVKFLSMGFGGSGGLWVAPADSGHVVLSKFYLGREKFEDVEITAAYGDTVATPAGKVVVSATGACELTEPVRVARIGYRAAAAGCSARLEASLMDKMSTVIALKCTDVNIQRADDVLWMVINVYNENWIKDKNLISSSTNEFIAERLRIIEQELGDVDKAITSFRSTHRLPDNSAVAMDMQISSETGKRLVELANQQSIARMLRSEIVSAREGTLLPANVGLSDGNTQNQIGKYNDVMLQRNRLVENSSEDNLLVKDMDAQLVALRSAILNSLDNYLRSVDIQIQSAQQVQRASDERVGDVPLQAGEILSDERQQKVKQALYIFLLQKREENELSQAFTAYTTRVIASPGGSNSPVAPNRKMLLLLALVIGFGLPFGYFYLREAMITTVRGRKDLEHLNAPFLGEIPSVAPYRHFVARVRARLQKFDPSDQQKREIVVKPHSRDIINEAFRVVRTNLEFMQGKEPGCKVLMVTSFNVGSGKTFISSNLAAALAVKHRRVLAIDLDLRKRSLSLLVDKPKKGVTDYIAGRTDDYSSLIVKGAAGTSLDVLPVGMMPPNPAELLAEPRLEQLLTALRADYDYIFLDCPPIEIVTDADVVAPLADASIFVVRAGLLERSMLPQIDKYYSSKRYNNLCILLNCTEGAGHYGYRYAYKYGYAYGKYGHYGHYGYGYGSKEAYYGSSSDDSEEETV